MDLKNNKKGFTLVEILLVMMIMGVLGMLAINGYTGYRRYALVNYSAESLVSQMDEYRDRVAHGVFGGEEPKCFGVYFGDETVKGFELKYSNKKVWDAEIGDWVFSACETFDPARANLYDLELDYEALSFSGLDKFAIIYYPPNSDVIVYDPLNAAQADVAEVLMQYGESSEERFQKKIFINVTTGDVEKS